MLHCNLQAVWHATGWHAKRIRHTPHACRPITHAPTSVKTCSAKTPHGNTQQHRTCRHMQHASRMREGNTGLRRGKRHTRSSTSPQVHARTLHSSQPTSLSMSPQLVLPWVYLLNSMYIRGRMTMCWETGWAKLQNWSSSHMLLQDWNPYRGAWALKTSTWQKPVRQMIWSDLEGRRRRKQRHPGGVGLRRNGGRTCGDACLAFNYLVFACEAIILGRCILHYEPVLGNTCVQR